MYSESLGHALTLCSRVSLRLTHGYQIRYIEYICTSIEFKVCLTKPRRSPALWAKLGARVVQLARKILSGKRHTYEY